MPAVYGKEPTCSRCGGNGAVTNPFNGAQQVLCRDCDGTGTAVKNGSLDVLGHGTLTTAGNSAKNNPHV